MDEISMAHNTSSINANHIKMEVLHTFENIDGELNINDSVNSEMSGSPDADIKIEMALESDSSNGNIRLKSENKNNNNSPSEENEDGAITDQNYNLTSFVEGNNKDLMVVKSIESNVDLEKALNFRRQLQVNDPYGLELNNSRISGRIGVNMNGSSDNDLILRISDDSDDSDTDEVNSGSSDSVIDVTNDHQNKQIIQRDELLLDGSVLENHEDDKSIDETLHETLHENLATVEPRPQNKGKKKSDTSQTTLLKFLIPRQSLMQESPGIKKGNDSSPMTPHISISQLIINSCTNCDKGYTTFGTKTKKCKDCGKRMKFNCFICEKLYSTRSGIYSHVLHFHQFSLQLFNEKIHSFIKSFCSKCKSTSHSQHSVCSKCYLNLEFSCLVCHERCKKRSEIHVHVVQNHTEEFVRSQKISDTNRQKPAKINKEKGLLKDDEDRDRKDASLIDKNTAASRNSGKKMTSSGRRRIRFQLDNTETEIEDISKSETAFETLCPTPRYSIQRRSISAKIVASTETHNKSNNKTNNKLSDPKQSVSNKRQSTNVIMDSSESKNFTKAISENEDTTKTPTGPKQQITGRRRSSRINMNSSEANSVSEAINSDGSSTKTPSSAPKISGRRRSIKVEVQQNSIDDIPPKEPVDQQIRRRSSRISSGSNSINNQNEISSVDVITASEISEPRQKNTNKRRRSRSVTDKSDVNNHSDISFVDVHPVPVKYESKQQTTTGRRRSLRAMPKSESTSTHAAITTPDVSVPMQQISGKRRSIRKASVNFEPITYLENGYTDIPSAPKTFAPKIMQGKRRSSRLDTNEINSHSESTSLTTITTTPEMSTTRQQVTNKRRKSRNSITDADQSDNNCSEISIDETNVRFSEVPDLLQCNFCPKIFVDQKACKKHESYCRKEPDIFCDSCSYATKYVSNLKKHMLIMHGPIKDSETIETKTSRASLNGNFGYGTLYTIDSTCTDILSKMEAYCPKCMEDAKMKPNDSHCRKCRSKLKLSCVKCCKVFPDFLTIFNHLYKECSEKQYHCAQCTFTTTSLDNIQAHVNSDHSNVSSNPSGNEKSTETPFVFAARPKAPVSLDDAKMKLNKVGFKTRAQSSVKPKEKVAVGANTDSESKLKKCSKCNDKVHSLVKHLIQCKAQLRCPFCSYATKTKQIMRKHLVRCHNTKSHTVRFQSLFADERIKRRGENRPDIEEMMRSYCINCDKLQESIPYEFECATCLTDLEYRCLKCQARFALREHLRKHVWNHAKSTNNFSCTGCSKRFSILKSLRMHEKVCSALTNASI